MPEEDDIILDENNNEIGDLGDLSDDLDDVVDDEELTLDEKVEELKQLTSDIQRTINANVNVVTRDLAELLTNSVNMVDKFHEIFLDTEPHYVELQQYDSEGNLITTKIPNRAMDKSIAMSGEGDPEGVVEANVGAFYIDSAVGEIYIKKVGNSSLGWHNMTPKEIDIFKDTFSVNSSTTQVKLSHPTSDKAMVDLYVNGSHQLPSIFTLDEDGQTLHFSSTLPNNATLVASYISGLYGVAGERGEKGDKGDQGEPGLAATIRVGVVSTGTPGSHTKVTNRGTANQAIFDFTIPRGDKGEKGDTGPGATLRVGTVSMGDPGTTAIISNSGTNNNAVFDFTIPKGDKGDKGDTGDSGVYCGSEEPEDESVKVWVDANGELSLIGALSLPMTGYYKDFDLAYTGVIFEADNHGYLVIAKRATQAGQYVQIDGTHETLTNKSMIFTGGTAPVANSIIYCPPVPMSRGQQVKITYTADGSTIASRFIYTMSTLTHPEVIDDPSGEGFGPVDPNADSLDPEEPNPINPPSQGEPEEPEQPDPQGQEEPQEPGE